MRKYDGIFNATLAEKGSVTFYSGKEYYATAIPVEKIVDTTGCDDSYVIMQRFLHRILIRII